MPSNKQTAVAPATLTHDELMAALGQSGAIQQGGSFRRMTLLAGKFKTDPGLPHEELWPGDKKGLAMVVRIMGVPRWFNAFFMREDELNGAVKPSLIGRPDLEGKFAKKYDNPQDQARDPWANLDAYEALAEALNERGGFKGDIDLQILPESGEFTGNEPVYTLTLGATSGLDWRGTRANPQGGTVQEKNFIVQLAELAAKQAAEAGLDKNGQLQAVLNAQEQLRYGGVVAELYVLEGHDERTGNSWPVAAFKPIYINETEQTPALETGEEPEDDFPL